ncbi:MAG: hypothetical protein IJH55_07850 [Romboutsia sp.]|nr:hypothetical protein [Romboutsia sp.]
MRKVVLKKTVETLNNLHDYINLILEIRHLFLEYKDDSSIKLINDLIESANEFYIDVNEILNILEDDTIIINDMPDTINKLNIVNKEINDRMYKLNRVI